MQHIQHTVGINGFFARLVQDARREPGNALYWWETGAVCERHCRVGEQCSNLRPDAEAAYQVRSRQVRFWLEWDCGTMNARHLLIKFTSYAYYIASHEWARECSILPVLVCIAPDIVQERRMQHVAQARLAHTPGLVLWTTTEVLLHEQGSLAIIWLQSIRQRSRVSQPGGSHRQCLFDVILGKNCM